MSSITESSTEAQGDTRRQSRRFPSLPFYLSDSTLRPVPYSTPPKPKIRSESRTAAIECFTFYSLRSVSLHTSIIQNRILDSVGSKAKTSPAERSGIHTQTHIHIHTYTHTHNQCRYIIIALARLSPILIIRRLQLTATTMGSSSGSHSTNHTRYSSPRGGISPYAAPYTDRRANSYHSDSRGGMMSDRDGTEEPSTQRKRIAVAVSPLSTFFPLIYRAL